MFHLKQRCGTAEHTAGDSFWNGHGTYAEHNGTVRNKLERFVVAEQGARNGGASFVTSFDMRNEMTGTLELICRECGHTRVLDAKEQAAIVAELKMPAQTKIIDCPCGRFQWGLAATKHAGVIAHRNEANARAPA